MRREFDDLCDLPVRRVTVNPAPLADIAGVVDTLLTINKARARRRSHANTNVELGDARIKLPSDTLDTTE